MESKSEEVKMAITKSEKIARIQKTPDIKTKKYFLQPDYLRNIIFGMEDSLVSTVGVLFGLASSGEYNSHQLILAGLVLTSVEALSMGVGSYLSEEEIHELDIGKSHKDNTIIDGALMFLAYYTGGILTLSPYFFLTPDVGKYYSFAVAVIMLFISGYLPSKKIKAGLRMAIIASAAIIIGYSVGVIFGA